MYIPARGSGAPSHTAPRGALYYRTSNDTVYKQTAGPTGSTWVLWGDGDLVSTQNLSDVSDALTARSNLKLLYSILTSAGNSSTTTMANSSLSLTVEAGGWYVFDAELKVSAELNAGFKFDLDGGAATMTGVNYSVEAITTTGTAGHDVLSAAVTSLATDTTVGASSLSASVRLRGFLHVSGAGTVILRFARVGASNTAVLGAGSWIKLEKAA